MKEPNPGSNAAIAKGCRCPVIDNYYGAGIPSDEGPQFWINDNCPLHGCFTNPAPAEEPTK